jgi:hypothetical protein
MGGIHGTRASIGVCACQADCYVTKDQAAIDRVFSVVKFRWKFERTRKDSGYPSAAFEVFYMKKCCDTPTDNPRTSAFESRRPLSTTESRRPI